MGLVVGEMKVVKPFYKALVIKPEIFSSCIVDERHFETREEAEEFQSKVFIKDNSLHSVICPMC